MNLLTSYKDNYNLILRVSKNQIKKLKLLLLDDEKLEHISTNEIVESIKKVENSINEITELLQKNYKNIL